MITRYEDEQIEAIWNREAELDRWFAIEIARMRQVRGMSAAERLEKIGPPDAVRVADLEEVTRHDVMAFLLAVDERIQQSADYWLDVSGEPEAAVQGQELRQWLHYGLTSSDVTDTALGMALRATHQVLADHALQLLTGLGLVCSTLLSRPPVMARTHGQYATAMPAAHRWQVLYGNLVTAIRNFHASRADVLIGKMSGPVGTSRAYPATEELLLRRLGLTSVPSTQLVPRVALAHWAHGLAEITTVCEAIATQVWLLAQQNVAEVFERSAPEQVGSSAMPHKSNPIRSENIRGLARLARMNAEVLQYGVIQWGEHDLSHSSVERVALPDLCHLAASILVRTESLLSGLQFRPGEAIPDDYVDTHLALMAAQRDGKPYAEAHAELRSQPYPDGKIGPDYNPIDPSDEGVAPGTAGW